MKLCAVVVTYYPDVKDAINNIMQYLPWVDHLVIWENTPSEDIKNYRIEIPEYADNISYMGTGKNEGIAFALNRAVDYAQSHGYTYLLTMDQDSVWRNFKLYRDNLNKDSKEGYAAFAPLIYDRKRNKTGYNTNTQFITSGAIYSIEKYTSLGKFCEEFKIDCVDTEYALRIQKYKYKVKIQTDCILEQSFGAIKKVRFLNCYHANYSSFRLYYIVRNNIWMWKMYRHSGLLPKRFLFNDIVKRYLIREPILVILCGERKLNKLYAILKGLAAGIFKYKG